jgi:hypothetical protein
MQACVQKIAGDNKWQPYQLFLVCMPTNYKTAGDVVLVYSVTACAKEDGSHYQDNVSSLIGCS